MQDYNVTKHPMEHYKHFDFISRVASRPQAAIVLESGDSMVAYICYMTDCYKLITLDDKGDVVQHGTTAENASQIKQYFLEFIEEHS